MPKTQQADAPDDAPEVDAQAAINEAKHEPAKVTFDYDGSTYQVPADAIDDLELRLHLEASHWSLFAQELLGPKQWAAFLASGKPKRKWGDALELVDAWSAAAGLGK